MQPRSRKNLPQPLVSGMQRLMLHGQIISQKYWELAQAHYEGVEQFADEILSGDHTPAECVRGLASQWLKCAEFALSLSTLPLDVCRSSPIAKNGAVEFNIDAFSEAADPVPINVGESVGTLSATNLLLPNAVNSIPLAHVRFTVGPDPAVVFVSLVNLRSVVLAVPAGTYAGKIVGLGGVDVAALQVVLTK